MAFTPVSGGQPIQPIQGSPLGPVGNALQVQIGDALDAPHVPAGNELRPSFADKVKNAFASFKSKTAEAFKNAGHKISAFFKQLGQRISDARHNIQRGPVANMAQLHSGTTRVLDFDPAKKAEFAERLSEMLLEHAARGDGDFAHAGGRGVANAFAGDAPRATYRINGETLISQNAYKQREGAETVPDTYLRDHLADLGIAAADIGAVTSVAHQGLFAEHIRATQFTEDEALVAFADAPGFPTSVSYDISTIGPNKYQIDARADKNVNVLVSEAGTVDLDPESSTVSYQSTVIVDTSGEAPAVHVQNAATTVSARAI